MTQSESELLARDAEARRIIREDLGVSILVEAAAGTGKTTVLVGRLVEALKRGATTVDRIVAVTFTKKAAGELKLRLRQELDAARDEMGTSPGERANLESAIAHLEEARVGTIHSFCADLLRQRPVEARIDPAFEEIDEERAREIMARVVRRYLEERLEELPPGLRRVASRPMPSWRPDDLTLIQRISEAAWSLSEFRDFSASWKIVPYDRPGEIGALLERASVVAGYARRMRPSALQRRIHPAADFVDWLDRVRGVGSEPDLDVLEGKLVELLGQLKRQSKATGRGREAAPGLSNETVVSDAGALVAALEGFAERSSAELASIVKEELSEIVERYQDAKRREGAVDFVDLLILTRDLVRSDRDARAHLQAGFSHVFVDEFQDTDPLQVEILLLLAANSPEVTDWRMAVPTPGKLFLVGDPKQSIYRFRRADMQLYHSVKSSLAARGVLHLELTRSFRGTRPLQALINSSFREVMRADPRAGQAEYVALAGGPPSALAAPAIVLPVGSPFGSDWVTQERFTAEAPRTIGAFLEWLIRSSGWKVRDPADAEKHVPVSARHVAVLFRQFVSNGADTTRELVRELELRGLPHVLVGSRSFHRRPEVETVRAAATAIEWPEDDVAVYATLRGALFGFSDEQLLTWLRRVGTIDPFAPRPEPEESMEELSRALDLLRYLHRRRNRRPVADTISELLEVTRALAGFALRPAGDQVLANVLRVVDLARAYESRGAISFRGFVELLADEAERTRGAESPVVEDSVDGVRLMTVHSAKGLEFPIVILADPWANMSRGANRSVDSERGLCVQRILDLAPIELREREAAEAEREQAESIRLAYVAATRAKDLLVVPWVGVEYRRVGWVGPLLSTLMPQRMSWGRARPAESCPPFGERTVLDRAPGSDECVRPGLHEVRGSNVIWWDPALLASGPADPVALEHVALLVQKGNEEVAEASRALYERFRSQRAEDLERGAAPSARPFNPTQASADPPGYSQRVEIARCAIKPKRPSGRRFGTLVHSILAHVDLDADREGVARLAWVHGTTLGAPADEIRHAVDPVVAALGHSLLARARAASEVRREWPFVLDLSADGLEDGDVIEGSIDLAFLEGGAWHVVDFKTDADLDPHFDAYRRQVRWYMYAISGRAKAPVTGWLLRV
ncbi:MAG: UvrD-helicase domain-containing protein [Deltaproteobacteria bacterium]|nr:UvrD-helicase domain-containing protein [Deltaproteobacteria bacterium]